MLPAGASALGIKGPGAPVMDGSGWDATAGEQPSGEQNVKADPRVEIYAPTSGSDGCLWNSTDKVAVTAFLPSSPKCGPPVFVCGDISRMKQLRGQVFPAYLSSFFFYIAFLFFSFNRATLSVCHVNFKQGELMLNAEKFRKNKRCSFMSNFNSMHKLRADRLKQTNQFFSPYFSPAPKRSHNQCFWSQSTFLYTHIYKQSSHNGGVE